MNLRFTKMHGLGNDFMVIDGISQSLPETGVPFAADEIRRLGDRHFGVGFDQMLIVQPARAAGADFRYRILNADGSEVSQCGNGARCFARFVRDHGLTDKAEIVVETAAGQMPLAVTDDEQVTVDMGAPRWAPASRCSSSPKAPSCARRGCSRSDWAPFGRRSRPGDPWCRWPSAARATSFPPTPCCCARDGSP